MEPWDQLDDETPRNYAYFCLYRDMGVLRSLDKAYKVWSEQQAGQTLAVCPRAPGQWRTLAQKHLWQERAEQYDAYRERKARQHAEAEHQLELEAFRMRQKRLGITVTNTAIQTLQLVNRKLERMNQCALAKTGATADDDDAIDAMFDMKDISSLVRAAAAAAQIGTNAEAGALAVEELLKAPQQQSSASDD